MNYTEFKNKFQKVAVEEYPHCVSDDPVVSVCVQTYQHVNYIKQCLDGILNQKTNFPFEILLGDDASTDGTAEICADYANSFPDKIKFFKHKRENNISINGTPTGRFILLNNLYIAKGRYIALCEGDDYWIDELKLQKQKDFLDSNIRFSMCFTDAEVADKDGNFIKKKLPDFAKKHLSQDDILSDITPPTLTSFFRRESCTTDLPEAITKVLNGDLFLFSLISFWGEAGYLDLCSAVYRLHGNGIWSKLDKILQQRRKIDTFKIYKNTGLVKNPQIIINTINSAYTNYLDDLIDNCKFNQIITVLMENFWFNLKLKNFYFIQLLKLIIIRRKDIKQKILKLNIPSI